MSHHDVSSRRVPMSSTDHPRRGPDRRQFLAFGVGALVVAALPITVRRRQLFRRSLPLMGTIADVAVVHRDARHAEGAIDAAMEALLGVEREMTRFDDASDVGRVNLGAFAAPVAVSARTALVIAEGLRWAEASGGRYDPAIGRVVRLWDVNHRHEPPPADAVRRLAGRRLHTAVEVDRFRGQPVVRFHDPDASIDLGSIAKGYGLDQAVAALREWGITDAIVNVGGDLYAMGRSPEGDPWRVGIRSPSEPDRIAGEIEVSDRAVATSGDYMQFFRWRGVKYHHLMDPTTGAPRRTTIHSDTVVADCCFHADVAASTVFGLSASEAEAILRVRAPGAHLVRNL